MRLRFGILSAFLILLCVGCRKSESGSRRPAGPPPLAPHTVVRLHWVGKEFLETNDAASALVRLWDLRVSRQLEEHVLYELAIAPWRWLGGQAPATNTIGLALFPLLNDVVQRECFLELRRGPGSLKEFVFAIRLDQTQAVLWERNLAAAIRMVTGAPYAFLGKDQHSWMITPPRLPERIQLTRVRDWTVVGVGNREQNALFRETGARIFREGTAFGGGSTNNWLQAEFDLGRLPGILPPGWFATNDLPKGILVAGPAGTNVELRASLTFPATLPVKWAPWEIPTNRIIEPLLSFTAMRGFEPWLASNKAWRDLQAGAPPDQLCAWTLDGVPMQILATAPLPDAANKVRRAAAVLMQKAGPWLATHDAAGKLERLDRPPAVLWTGLPSMAPFIKAGADGNAIFAGLLPNVGAGTNAQSTLYPHPSLRQLVHTLSTRTNLLYLHWELTGPRVNSWLYVSRAIRAALKLPQLPLDSYSLTWLGNVKDRLGNCTTEITLTGTNQLSIVRRSTLGLNAVELHLLTDWLESPQFPIGLHTFRASAKAAPHAPAAH